MTFKRSLFLVVILGLVLSLTQMTPVYAHGGSEDGGPDLIQGYVLSGLLSAISYFVMVLWPQPDEVNSYRKKRQQVRRLRFSKKG